MLPDELKEKIVKYIDIGHTTYADIHEKFPYVTALDWYSILFDTFPESKETAYLGALGQPPKKDTPLICLQQCPKDFNKLYKFQPSDVFILTIEGRNMAYRLKKEKRKDYLAIMSVIFAAIAAVTGIAALFH